MTAKRRICGRVSLDLSFWVQVGAIVKWLLEEAFLVVRVGEMRWQVGPYENRSDVFRTRRPEGGHGQGPLRE